MRKKLIVIGIILFLCELGFCIPVFAQIKFQWGPYWRVRHEYWKNWKDMDSSQKDNRNFFRIKTSLWGKMDYDDDYSLYMKLTNEMKPYTYFGGASTDKSASKKGYRFDINEVVFDNLYADAKDVFNLPVDFRMGRQDLSNMYGENFLISDGTPGDGSRTYYFNAVKSSWKVNEENTVDFIYINDPRDEEFLPVINRTMMVRAASPNSDKVPQSLNTTDEQGYVLYWKNKSVQDLALEGYYIFKKEAEEGGTGYQSQGCDLNTLGSYVKYNFSPFVLRGQLAGQFGDYGNNDREGVGGYVFLDRAFKENAWTPAASIGYIYLSGDNQKTSTNEGWDPLFSRAPWISELYNLSMSAETGITAYWTNLSALRTEFSLKPSSKIKLTFWYNFLRANNQVAASSVFSGRGKTRGHLFQGKAEYVFNKTVSTYFLAEFLDPGNFYKVRDDAVFLRSEIQIKF